ncbi:MAG: DUF177 domain-containing protein [Prevotella sp.]|jgi:uncharacterized metal-binding protein YceD (DUF177 family)|nr:DUF177 domain-containing protein [Prevotella sp.]MBQ6031492.1 DUF177 domain-containing protein [Prevotella sp.]MBQ6308997.1 DUF177 domain-containing protein [Prevotella sp.]MBQ9571322.1 DUF177 domain-containing protein [Prevotella sp.]MBR0524986.1 DUF177 domain-containing protein [Prevotella sp.]
MYQSESLKIDLKGLQEGLTTLEYTLDDTYFQEIESSEISAGQVHVKVEIRKTRMFWELMLHTEGLVTIPCNLCMDDMEQLIAADNRLVVKLGEENNEDDELVIVDEDEGILDLSWYIYEFIALAIPIRHVHAPGKCNAAMMKVLEEHSTDRSSDEESTTSVDPRWEKLKNIKF